MFGIAAELIESLRIEIAKIRMLAQHSQFAARKRPRYSFIIFGHPIIQQFHVAHHRRIALPARLAESDRPPHSSIIRRLDAHSKQAPVSLRPVNFVVHESYPAALWL